MYMCVMLMTRMMIALRCGRLLDIDIDIYIYRERERYRYRYGYIYIYIHIHIHTRLGHEHCSAPSAPGGSLMSH